MLFQAKGSNFLMHGSFRQESFGLIVRSGDTVFIRDEIAFVIPDDYNQQELATKAGYPVHTPLSMNLGAGATSHEFSS